MASYADFFFSYWALASSVASLYGCETSQKTRLMDIQASMATYFLVFVRELAPRSGDIGEDLAVGHVRVCGLDLFADLVLVEEIGRGRAFGRVGILGLLFFHLPLAFFAVAVERAVVGRGSVLVLVRLLGTARLALHGGAIGDGRGRGRRLQRVREGERGIRLGNREDVLEVVGERVGLVRTLAEDLRGLADAGDELRRTGDATSAV